MPALNAPTGVFSPQSPSVALVDGLLAQALAHIRADRIMDAIGLLTSQEQVVLQTEGGCHLLGLLYVGTARHDAAIAAFDQALRLRHDWPDVLASRAVALQQAGRLIEALADNDAAIRLGHADPSTRYNRGVVLQLLNRSEEALAAYDAALHLKPCYPEALANRGIVLHGLGRLTAALISLEQAVALRPDDPTTHFNRATVLKDLEHHAEALQAYRQALILDPAHIDARCGAAIVLRKLGHLEEAIAACDEALRRAPDCFTACFHRANILHDTKRFEEALQGYDAALRLQPSEPDVLANCGATLFGLNRLEEALAYCDAALSLRADFPAVWSNRGNVLQRLQRLDEARASLDEALRLRPVYPEALVNRGVVLKLLGHFDQALADFDHALELLPNDAHARNNRGALLLLHGRFKEGWEDYESRWLAEDRPNHKRQRFWTEWTGEPLAGKSILVLDEQGLGDVIQFSRYLPLLARRGAKVSFACRPFMHRLLRSLPADIRLIDKAAAQREAYDFEIGLVSLPKAFGTDLASVPAECPYLSADPALVKVWAERLGHKAGLKIGICWTGNLNPRADVARSIELSHFAGLAAVPSVRLISLQKNEGSEQLARLAPMLDVETFEQEIDAGGEAFVDTAAIMANLDLVITCDTSLAHLAGALGKPVWVALKDVPDWRWLLGREDSLWYRQMHLFRQTRRGQWDDVFARMTEALRRLARPDGPLPSA
jgi:tetratricopeptide (TPR) repeat protein